MAELLVPIIGAILGAAGAMVAYRSLDKFIVDRKQKQFEKQVLDFSKKEAELRGQQAKEDKQTQDKVNEIEHEKNSKQSTSSLIDFFRNRK